MAMMFVFVLLLWSVGICWTTGTEDCELIDLDAYPLSNTSVYVNWTLPGSCNVTDMTIVMLPVDQGLKEAAYDIGVVENYTVEGLECWTIYSVEMRIRTANRMSSYIVSEHDISVQTKGCCKYFQPTRLQAEVLPGSTNVRLYWEMVPTNHCVTNLTVHIDPTGNIDELIFAPTSTVSTEYTTTLECNMVFVAFVAAQSESVLITKDYVLIRVGGIREFSCDVIGTVAHLKWHPPSPPCDKDISSYAISYHDSSGHRGKIEFVNSSEHDYVLEDLNSATGTIVDMTMFNSDGTPLVVSTTTCRGINEIGSGSRYEVALITVATVLTVVILATLTIIGILIAVAVYYRRRTTLTKSHLSVSYHQSSDYIGQDNTSGEYELYEDVA